MTINLSSLSSILVTDRIHLSLGEDQMFDTLILAGGESLGRGQDAVFFKVGESDTLFSCHIDTYASKARRVQRKGLYQYQENGDIFVTCSTLDDILGADDGAGIWLMYQMILYGVPGNYIFFRGEENLCYGSSTLIAEIPEFFSQFQRAISFDHAGTNSVVIVVNSFRTKFDIASSEFGECLVEALSFVSCDQGGKGFFLEEGGLTDVAILSKIIPECANIGVGYYKEHTKDEYLNVSYLNRLLGIVKEIDWETFPTNRA